MMTADTSRRAALLDAMADHVLAHGVASASLRPLAAAAGTSDRMLLYYFPDKSALIASVLETIAARLTIRLAREAAGEPLPRERLQRRLARLLLADEFWPYMQVWLEAASLAARGDAVMLKVGGAIGRGFLAWGAAQLDAPPEVRDAEAARLMIAIEGMVLLKSLGMDDAVEAALGELTPR